MTHKKQIRLLAIAASLLIFSACAKTEESKPAVVDSSDKPAANSVSASPGKPSAPISFRYEVMGNPIVGQPVSVNVFVSSSVPNAPINLSYRVVDSGSMMFPDSQALKTVFSMAPGEKPSQQQITVIPQREGRLYLNVSAEIKTSDDTMLKSMSIPIQVGNAPPEMEVNGELIETADGEVVISMPAEQN